MTPPTGENVLFVLNGLERSGTIWATRLLADSLQVAARSRYHVPPFEHADDPAVWRMDRPGKFIRRLHYFVNYYPYESVPCVIIMRDPRDVALSQFEAVKANESLCQYTERLVPAWCKFHLEWKEDPRATAWLRYEDLLDDAESEMCRVLQELGLRFDFRNVRRAVREHEYSVMDNRHKGNYGRAGAGHDNLPADCSVRIWEQYGETLSGFRYGRDGVMYGN